MTVIADMVMPRPRDRLGAAWAGVHAIDQSTHPLTACAAARAYERHACASWELHACPAHAGHASSVR